MAARIAHWLYILLVGLIALYLTLLGGFLVYMGGSLYYGAAGVAMAWLTYQLIRRRPGAVKTYGAILAVTVLWSLYEAELDLLALMPRLMAWLVFGIWFITPWYRASLQGVAPVSSGRWIGLPSAVACLLLLVASFQGYHQGSTGTVKDRPDDAAATDWRHYGNTAGGTRFGAIDQINTETVRGLREVWRFRTGVEADFKMTPLQVDGLLYLCGARNILIAVDDATGDEVWRHDPKAIPPAKHQYARTCRGISYFEAGAEYDGPCQARIVTATIDARMIAVNGRTGVPCADFGDSGQIDLRTGMGEHLPNQYYLTSPPLVADDVLVVGGLVLDSQDLGLPSGVVRAFDAVTGAFVWAWDLGNPGYYGEPKDGEIYTPGTPNVWSVMSYDPALDLVYAPTGNASPDYYGGERRVVDEEWSSAVVAIDAGTGEPRWKYQTVHHDVWDYDVPAQPVLVDVDRAGETVPSVAVPTKRGDVFLLDRRTGEPVFPIEERAVPTDTVGGEQLSPTQPFSPLPGFHPYRHEKDMWGLTPLDQLLCRVEYKLMRYEGLFTPPTPQGSFQYPANFGGFNWGSVSVDADNGLLVAAPQMLGNRTMLFTPEQVAAAGPRAALVLGTHHPAVRMDPESPLPEPREVDPNDPYDHVRIKYYGVTLPFMSRFWFPFVGGTQVPCFEPPWSRLAVIDLNTKELLWSRPVGSMKDSGPFGWRVGLPFQVGTPLRAGTLTTRGGLTFLSSTMDSTVRAFDLRTGEVLWSDGLPGSGQATPMTYVSQKTGKQYVIVTVPNPSWRYPRDPATGTYTDSKSVKDGKGGYVIAYALD